MIFFKSERWGVWNRYATSNRGNFVLNYLRMSMHGLSEPSRQAINLSFYCNIYHTNFLPGNCAVKDSWFNCSVAHIFCHLRLVLYHNEEFSCGVVVMLLVLALFLDVRQIDIPEAVAWFGSSDKTSGNTISRFWCLLYSRV